MFTSGRVVFVFGLYALLATVSAILKQPERNPLDTGIEFVLIRDEVTRPCLGEFATTLTCLLRKPNKFTYCSEKRCKAISIILFILIAQSGDIETNPGPNTKYPCGICAKNVAWNAKAIQCDGCNIWFHSRCANIGPRSFSLLRSSSLTWICTNCGIPNLSSSLCVDIDDYSSPNKYDKLSQSNYSNTSKPIPPIQTIPTSSTPRKDFVQHPDIGVTEINESQTSDNSPPVHRNISSHANSEVSEPESPITSPSTLSISRSLDMTPLNTPKDQFSCVVINFQSVRNKQTELYNILSSMSPDVVIGNETHLQQDYRNSEILPHDIPSELQYKIFRKDRGMLTDKGGGGVMVMVKPEYDCEECPDLDSDCEIKWVRVITSSKEPILIGTFYREPKSPLETLDQLNNSLILIKTSKKYSQSKIILGGDFNLGDIDWETGSAPSGARDKAHCIKLCNILNEHCLEQMNRQPTRQGRLLDLFITSHPSLVQKCYTCPPIGLADHDVLAVNTLLRPTPQKKLTRTVYDYKKANWDSIQSSLTQFKDSFFKTCNNNSVEDNWNNFKSSIFSAMDESIPKKQLKTKPDVPWMTNEIKRMIRKKHRLYKRIKQSNDQNLKEQFKELRITVRNKLHSSYYKYLNSMLDPETDTASKSFWKYIKSRKQDTMNIGTLRASGRVADTPGEKATMLNEQFTSVFTKETNSDLPDLGPSPHQSMPNINISVNGVIKCLERLNEKKATGPDKIPITILKKFSKTIAPVLAFIYQQSLNTGEVPSDWKNANVVPIYKKGDRTKPENYRPVSLTAVASKMMEHILVSQIMDHLDNGNILHENQHGFRAKRSCEAQLIMTTDDLAKDLNNKHKVDMAILDFSKAFDKVSHRRLSHKLDYYGIRGNTRRWIDNFLTGRQQQVVIDNASSDSSPVTSGVPQGTVLGPALFLIYINDICNNINSTIRLFADDCVVYRPITSPEDNQILQEDLGRLEQWGDTWSMEFNVKKCAIMQFSSSNAKSIHKYFMKGEQLEQVQHHPYLGVELSDNLKFNQHIDNITKKASSILGFLKRNLKHCPQKVKERAYQSLVRPKLEYSSPVWNPQQKTQVNQLEQIQRNAARFVCNRPFNPNNPDSVTDMMTTLRWTPLYQRRILSDVTFMYKLFNGLVAIPPSYHPTLATTRSTRTSHTAKFIPPHCRVNVYQHSFIPRTVPHWNNLPETVVTAPTLESFKGQLQQAPLKI